MCSVFNDWPAGRRERDSGAEYQRYHQAQYDNQSYASHILYLRPAFHDSPLSFQC